MRLRTPQFLLHMAIVFALVAAPVSMVEAHSSSNLAGSSTHTTHASLEPAVEHMVLHGDAITGSTASDCVDGMDPGSHHSSDSNNACCYGMCLADVIDATKMSTRDRVPSRFIREAPSALKCADLVAPRSPPRA